MLSFYLSCFLLLTLVVFVSVIYACVKVSLPQHAIQRASYQWQRPLSRSRLAQVMDKGVCDAGPQGLTGTDGKPVRRLQTVPIGRVFKPLLIFATRLPLLLQCQMGPEDCSPEPRTQYWSLNIC